MLGTGVAKKTYIDDVFSTHLYTGNATSRSINTGVDMTEGGLVWIKSRSNARAHTVFDTARGANKYLLADHNHAETTNISDMLTGFNNNGFSLGADASSDNVNRNGYTQASWSFRKAKGFFDVVTWDGNGTAGRVMNHSLGCVPGLIMIKSTTHATAWFTYHRSLSSTSYVMLNEPNAEATGASWFMNSTDPTSTGFSLGGSGNVNDTGRSYVAYLFAGGESTDAAANAVYFDGTNDYLSIPDSADFNLGTASFTIEAWIRPDTGSMSSGAGLSLCNQTSASWYITVRGGGYGNALNSVQFYDGTSAHNSADRSIQEGQWTHIAFVNNSGTGTWYINGIPSTSGDAVSAPNVPDSSGAFEIGRANDSYFKGNISNFRIVKGTAVYTAPFKPTNEPLTNITNTKLLCCNSSSQTGSTVTPGTITNNGTTANISSPFDDIAAFTFGENGDQSIVKTGSYVGNEQTTKGPEIYLGWEPQWVMIKTTAVSDNWVMFDSMRGLPTGGNDHTLYPNDTYAEASSHTRIDVTPTGFHITENDNKVNGNGHKLIYIAIRRPDGYVSKPATLGTDVFAMDAGAASSTIPNFDSGFPVDFATARAIASSAAWNTGARLMHGKYFDFNNNNAEASSAQMIFDSNAGWNNLSGWDAGAQSWMWKRHAGFDAISWRGRGGSKTGYTAHSLGVVPEMIWSKRRDGDPGDWIVYHKGLNGGTNPEQYYLNINDTGAESQAQGAWNYVAPTATHFSTGSWAANGGMSTNNFMLTLLFATIEGISKVGFYDGSSSSQTIECGFQPRFLIQKRVSGTGEWHVLDTTRGWGSGNDNWLSLESTGAQSSYDFGAPTSTGFTLIGGNNSISNTGSKYIYYAHA